ncbi:class I SAM-dependent methyltransferase [Winogradskyella vincentii]|uniref:Class I SAM-dependent methyltransferase n=1 Tax=Winogradskyella vincentii TaxID=2877122 RepID=A0ABS7XW40_9FLAO|nr:class I SAM-dependent methyltransferase [Winogradskyella vincentii]MCA0151870.1 class I SAM-dependent methyltransferase [Winogradskyella vincentii]
MKLSYLHPIHKTVASTNNDGTLFFEDTREVLQLDDGCLDFIVLGDVSEDKIHYDEYYIKYSRNHFPAISEEYLKKLWHKNSAYSMLYESMGEFKDKKILLLGNGVSLKELLFIIKGGKVVYTDISIEAVKCIKELFAKSKFYETYKYNIEFQAIDAFNLPYKDETFDIIYGCAFVHHLNDLPQFVTEVSRCLKADGACLFLDDAYSGWWQFLKRTILRPIQIYSHWKTGISPEDKIATIKGGYKETEVNLLLSKYGFNSIIFKRVSLFEHLFRRGILKLTSKKVNRPFVWLGKFIDKKLLGNRFIEKVGMNLVWGGKKLKD